MKTLNFLTDFIAFELKKKKKSMQEFVHNMHYGHSFQTDKATKYDSLLITLLIIIGFWG